ncbi:metallophosphoesterase [Kineococcus sp. NUM-3379]
MSTTTRTGEGTPAGGTGPAGPGNPNSRDSVAGAGWGGQPADLAALLPPALRGAPAFSWLRLASLTGGRRNDPLARLLGDPSHERREAWLRQVHGGAVPDLTVDRTDLASPSFLVMGDTGEGDASQYAPVLLLDTVGAGTDFMVLCSDVVYPGGGVLEYAWKLCWPYRDYGAPIYALPGNHDWYDGLRGFMSFFCGQDSAPRPPRRSLFSRAGLRDRLWADGPEPPDAAKQDALATLRRGPGQRATQPGSYFRLSTGPLDLIAVDTGIDGTLDAAQGRWLRRVSRGERPKVLLTGRPLHVDGEHHPCPIDRGRGGTVDDVVDDPAHRYVAVIGGDVHNYQRYPVRVGGRTVQHVVSGGGGAYTHPTHTIPNLDHSGIPGVTEDAFRCYPLRGDSLSFFSQMYDRRFPGAWHLSPAEAAAYLSQRLGIPPTKAGLTQAEVTEEVRRRGERVMPLPGRVRGPWHAVLAELLDWNEPPLFKHLLRLDATSTSLTIACHAATGMSTPAAPRPEDRVTCDLAGGDVWVEDT